MSKDRSKRPVARVPTSREKTPATGASVSGSKQPVTTYTEDRHAHIRFRFDRLDSRHWPLHKINVKDHERLLGRLKYFEALTVEQAQRQSLMGDHDMSECPNKIAAKVLRTQYDGLDTLTKLVIEPSGPLRLFGIRYANEFHIVWWDAKHEVWPEGKIRR